MTKKRGLWAQILSALWLPFGFLLLTLSVIIWGPVIVLLGSLKIPARVMKYLVSSWTILVPKYFFIRKKVYYPPDFHRHYPVDQPLVVVSNHQSLLDIPAAYLALPGNIRMLSKESLFKIPIFGWAMRAAGHIEIVRGNRASGRSALEAMKKQLRAGVQMWIAPEGTRSPDWHLGNFKPGGFALALDLNLPIQPIVVLNAYEILGKKTLFPQVGSTLEIQVLPLIDPQKLGLNDKVSLSQYVWEQMNAALKKHHET